ncbi:MAG: hypothetical protein R2865_01655 [Deinococcales bacterium]
MAGDVQPFNLITLIAHFIPTPGGSGFIEFAISLATSQPHPQRYRRTPLIWRLSTYYLIFTVPLAAWFIYRQALTPTDAL